MALLPLTTTVLTSGTFFSARTRIAGTGLPSVNFGPRKISETTRARMLKLKTQLDSVKCSLWVQKFLRYGASRVRRAH